MDKEHKPFLTFTRKDFRIDWYSGSGAGGQYRNKHQNCCRITHIASGLVATGQEARDRPTNQRAAFRRLVPKLIERYVAEEKRARYGNTETIRTYHEPDNRVKDHASELMLSYSETVGKNDLSRLIEARARHKLAE